MKLKKGDNVYIISGKEKGKRGIIEKVFPSCDKIMVTAVNLAKRHLKPSRKNPHGGIINKLAPFVAAKAMLVCPHCGKIVRVGYQITKSGKNRFCRVCRANLDTKS